MRTAAGIRRPLFNRVLPLNVAYNSDEPLIFCFIYASKKHISNMGDATFLLSFKGRAAVNSGPLIRALDGRGRRER